MNGNLKFLAIILLLISQAFLSLSYVECNDSSIVIQPSNADTYVSSMYLYTKFPEKPHGYLWGMFVGNTYYESEEVYGSQRIYIKFDLSALPQNSEIDSAFLRLYLYSSPVTTQKFNAHLVYEDWDEEEIIWVHQPDYCETPTSSAKINATSDIWVCWDVTEAVESWYLNDIENYGLMIKIENERDAEDQNAAFYPKEGSGSELRPKLEIFLKEEVNTSEPKHGDFSISTSPHSSSVIQGGVVTFKLTIDEIGDFNQPINLRVLDLPIGINEIFEPVSGKPPFISNLTINVSLYGLPGVYPIVIEASGEGKIHSVVISLIIVEKPKVKTYLVLQQKVMNGEIIISGSISPPIEGAIIKIIYTDPHAEEIKHEVYASSDGSFNDNYLPSSSGKWMVSAEWMGNDSFMPTGSLPKSIIIENESFKSTLLFSDSLYFVIIILVILVLSLIIIIKKKNRTFKIFL